MIFSKQTFFFIIILVLIAFATIFSVDFLVSARQGANEFSRARYISDILRVNEGLPPVLWISPQYSYENAGMYRDLSNNGNHGTQTTASYQPKLRPTGFDFDGLNDYIDCGSNASLNITDEITLEAWVNPSEDGWKYKKSITLSTSTTMADYQVKVELTPSNFDYSHASSTLADIRFTASDGETELDFWMESASTTATTTIWVEASATGTDAIYMYYGNSSASSASNGTTTFDFFDDFDGASLDGAKWNSGGTIGVSNSEVSVDADDYIVGKTTFGYGYAARAKVKADEQDTSFIMFSDFDGSHHNSIDMTNRDEVANDFDRFIVWHSKDGSSEWSSNEVDGWNDFRNTYYIYEINRFSATSVIMRQADNSYTFTDYSHTPTISLGVGMRTWDSTQASTVIADWFLVRKCVATEPVATVGSETVAGISKVGAYGINANTATAFASINNQTITGGTLSAGWNHIALTYDKDAGGTEEMKLFLNGAKIATGDYSTAISTNTNNFLIGDLIAFNGIIDEVKIYDKALSATQIQAMYLIGLSSHR